MESRQRFCAASEGTGRVHQRMRQAVNLSLSLLLITGLFLFSGAGSNLYAQTAGVQVIPPDQQAVSLPVSSMPDVQPATAPPAFSIFVRQMPTTLPPTDAATIQSQEEISSAVNPGLNLLGLGKGFANFTIPGDPPDPNGAVGDTQYVQWVNTSFAIFSKSTGSLIRGPVSSMMLWHDLSNACSTANVSDPVVVYDKAANRWVMTILAFAGVDSGDNPIPPFFECVAVSQTSDANGSYNLYSYNFRNFPDYPKVGVWPDAYYFSFNTFTSRTSFPTACAVDRVAALNGRAANIQCFDAPDFEGDLFLPSDLD